MSNTIESLLNPVDTEGDTSADGAFNSNGSTSRVAIHGGDVLSTGHSYSGGFPDNLYIHGHPLSYVSGPTMPSSDLGSQLELTTLGDSTNYSLEVDLLEWQNNLIPQDSSHEYFGRSSPSTILSQEVSQSSSSGPCSNQFSSDSFTQMSEDDSVVCYGMLHSIDMKLVGEMLAIDTRLHATDPMRWLFELKSQEDSVFVRFRDDGRDLGYLRSSEAKTLLNVLSQPNVDLEPIVLKSAMREIISCASKSTEATVKLDINVYGPRRESPRVSEILSLGKLWLQRPDHCRDGINYENPHFLKLEIKGNRAELPVPTEQVMNSSASRKKLREEQLRKLVREVYKSVDNNRHLHRAEGGQRVTQTLLRHQQEALAFMLERESGHINDSYRLWREVTLENTRVEYQHKITKARRSVRPEERGGGILADEMGMGKSLSILALAMRTLDDGREWAEQSNNSQTAENQIKHSRSTLILVSSGLLITNWLKEIREHLEEGLTVIEYHGRQRPRDGDIIQDSDIVITTYNTLAVEYQMNKIKPSILHRIGWYRVVLDEAHIIRRPSSVFNNSCRELHANSRWCLTGTPIQNKLADIGTLFAFIRAEPFSQASVFRKWIEVAFEHAADDPKQVKDRLIMLLEAFCLRRTRDLLELPHLRPHVRMLDFSPDERGKYESTKRTLIRSIKQRVGGTGKGSQFGLFQANLQLRILCNHGTFQKPFSWHRRSHEDERQAMECALGRDVEIKCSGCQQLMPIVGSSWSRSRFGDQCTHVLCSECLDESSIPASGMHPQRCPMCVRWHKPTPGHGARLAVEVDGESGDVESTEASAVRVSTDNDDVYYLHADGHSTKMKKLIEDVAKDVWETKSIIFSCWARTLRLVSKHLDQAKIPFLCIDGNCPLQQRQANIDRFRDSDEMPVLIMTTGTGAFGLNLTCANRIFIVELQWNPSVENQAIARAIRFGQKKEVHVIRYIIRNTVEEDMRKQQQWKKHLAAIGFEEPDLMDAEMQPL